MVGGRKGGKRGRRRERREFDMASIAGSCFGIERI